MTLCSIVKILHRHVRIVKHTIEECPQLIAKWQTKAIENPNQFLNANRNIQKILAEPWDKPPTIEVLTRGGTATGDDKGEPWHNMRIQHAIQKKVTFHVQKEKWVFFDAQNEFVDRNHTSTFVVPPVFDEGPIFDMLPSFD